MYKFLNRQKCPEANCSGLIKEGDAETQPQFPCHFRSDKYSCTLTQWIARDSNPEPAGYEPDALTVAPAIQMKSILDCDRQSAIDFMGNNRKWNDVSGGRFGTLFLQMHGFLHF